MTSVNLNNVALSFKGEKKKHETLRHAAYVAAGAVVGAGIGYISKGSDTLAPHDQAVDTFKNELSSLAEADKKGEPFTNWLSKKAEELKKALEASDIKDDLKKIKSKTKEFFSNVTKTLKDGTDATVKEIQEAYKKSKIDELVNGFNSKVDGISQHSAVGSTVWGAVIVGGLVAISIFVSHTFFKKKQATEEGSEEVQAQ